MLDGLPSCLVANAGSAAPALGPRAQLSYTPIDSEVTTAAQMRGSRFRDDAALVTPLAHQLKQANCIAGPGSAVNCSPLSLVRTPGAKHAGARFALPLPNHGAWATGLGRRAEAGDKMRSAGLEDMQVINTCAFTPYQDVMFVKTFNSWHAVRPMTGNGSDAMRKTLTINIEAHT